MEPSFPPDELDRLVSIVKERNNHQTTLGSMVLTSHRAKRAALPALYERPVIRKDNFRRFASVIRNNDQCAQWVKHLDLSRLVSRDGMMRRDVILIEVMLERCRETLESYVAPNFFDL
jgi:hypothetical protein